MIHGDGYKFCACCAKPIGPTSKGRQRRGKRYCSALCQRTIIKLKILCVQACQEALLEAYP